MSALPMTVTALSRYFVGETLYWQPTVLPGVLYRPYSGEHLATTGPDRTAQTGTLWIPSRGGRRSPAEFAAAQEKTGLFTLCPGDYIVPGTLNSTAVTGDVRDTYPQAVRIVSVTERIYGSSLDHWEVAVR